MKLTLGEKSLFLISAKGERERLGAVSSSSAGAGDELGSTGLGVSSTTAGSGVGSTTVGVSTMGIGASMTAGVPSVGTMGVEATAAMLKGSPERVATEMSK